MSVVLGIDTAGPVVGAAVWCGGAHREWSARLVRGADEALAPAVADLLAWVDRRCPGPLERVAVSVGPGAFTGLRVGVATALGVAMARGVPVVPVSSLAARARLAPDEARVLVALDARKGRVYAALFDTFSAVPALLSPEVDQPLAAALPPAPFVAVGEGALVHAAAIEQAGGSLAPGADACPALAVARLGLALPALDPGDVALRYLRPPDAVPPADLGRSVGR